MSNRGCNCTEVPESRAELRESKRAEKYALVLAEHQKKQRIHQAEREVLVKAENLAQFWEDLPTAKDVSAVLIAIQRGQEALAQAIANLKSARVS